MYFKRFALVILALILVGYLLGCGKKREQTVREEELMSLEALSTAVEEVPESVSAESVSPVAQQPDSVAQLGLEPLPPAGPYKPTPREIQTALKNAGYYTGPVDGKIGPVSKRAIEEFQKAKGLKVDGKVGPNTWSVLSSYLNAAPVTQETRTGKKR